MNKIVVTAADIKKILAWRDKHVDLVRSMPLTLSEVEIQCVESEISITCYRKQRKLKMYIRNQEGLLGHSTFVPYDGKMWERTKTTLPSTLFGSQIQRDAITVYSSLMALMVYAGSYPADQNNKKTAAGKVTKKVSKKSTSEVTYIIHSTGNRISLVQKGHHASPSCSFTVRGHFRHYKNGRTIWISEYKKGIGDEQSKTYKIATDNISI